MNEVEQLLLFLKAICFFLYWYVGGTLRILWMLSLFCVLQIFFQFIDYLLTLFMVFSINLWVMGPALFHCATLQRDIYGISYVENLNFYEVKLISLFLSFCAMA